MMTTLSFRLRLFIALSVCLVCGQCSKRPKPGSGYADVPQLQNEYAVSINGDTLAPVRLQLVEDTLFVSFRHQPRIDKFSLQLERIGSIALTVPEPIYPTSFFVTESTIIVCDHAKQAVIIFDREGTLLTSYGTLPDSATALSPFSLAYFRGIAYIGDAAQRRILAVSMQDVPEVTAQGELILTIPRNSDQRVAFPSALLVTPDGRLLSGDAGAGAVLAFTCDGQFIYAFDSVATARPMAPQAIALDSRMDPSLQDTNSFDPSGVRQMGRIHVADANNGGIHMFNPLGRYVATYTGEGKLIKPTGLAVDYADSLIYVADPAARRIFTFRY